MVRVRPQARAWLVLPANIRLICYPACCATPNAKMRAGAMPAVDLSATDMSALVSYLGALGTSAANVPAMHTAQPHNAPPPLRAGQPGVSPTTATAAVSIAAGHEIFETHACSACHGVAGAGTARAPALAALVANLPDTELAGAITQSKRKNACGRHVSAGRYAGAGKICDRLSAIFVPGKPGGRSNRPNLLRPALPK